MARLNTSQYQIMWSIRTMITNIRSTAGRLVSNANCNCNSNILYNNVLQQKYTLQQQFNKQISTYNALQIAHNKIKQSLNENINKYDALSNEFKAMEFRYKNEIQQWKSKYTTDMNSYETAIKHLKQQHIRTNKLLQNENNEWKIKCNQLHDEYIMKLNQMTSELQIIYYITNGIC